MRRASFTAGLLVAALSSATTLAADAGNCSGVDETGDGAGFRVGRVVGAGPRVNFVASAGDGKNTQSCPSANAMCKRNGFVVPGDAVLVDRVEGAYACATFVSPRGVATGGWLPAAALDIKPVPAPRIGDWAGAWKRVEADIVLRVAGAEVAAKGDATYGALSPERVKRGGVNIGEFSGKARPRGAMLAIGEGYDGAKSPLDVEKADNCLVRMRLAGAWLVVEDNRQCGGHNVSFTGVYTRAPK